MAAGHGKGRQGQSTEWARASNNANQFHALRAAGLRAEAAQTSWADSAAARGHGACVQQNTLGPAPLPPARAPRTRAQARDQPARRAGQDGGRGRAGCVAQPAGGRRAPCRATHLVAPSAALRPAASLLPPGWLLPQPAAVLSSALFHTTTLPPKGQGGPGSWCKVFVEQSPSSCRSFSGEMRWAMPGGLWLGLAVLHASCAVESGARVGASAARRGGLAPGHPGPRSCLPQTPSPHPHALGALPVSAGLVAVLRGGGGGAQDADSARTAQLERGGGRGATEWGSLLRQLAERAVRARGAGNGTRGELRGGPAPVGARVTRAGSA